jgi:hypothetical protein
MSDPIIETKKQKPEPAKAPPVAAYTVGEGRLAVKALYFDGPHPGFGGRTSVTSTPERTNQTPSYVVEFDPRIRHHRVEERRTDGPSRIVFIPEGQVKGWEAA